MASASMTSQMTPLQQIAVPSEPTPAPETTTRSEGTFKINWFNFRDHVLRSETDNQSGPMDTVVTICCRDPGNTDWKVFHASRSVLLFGSVELREEILARPDSRSIYMWKIPAKVMSQLMTYLHTGTLMAPLEEMRRFMLAKHQLRVGAVYGNDYSYQLIRIFNARTVHQAVTLSLESPWVTEEYLPRVLCDDMKENKNCAAECIAGQCIHKKRLGNPSIRIGLNRNSVKITRTPVDGNDPGTVSPEVTTAESVTGDVGDRVRVVALDHDYCGRAASGTANAEHRCDFCGRRFVNSVDLRQHQINIHYLRV